MKRLRLHILLNVILFISIQANQCDLELLPELSLKFSGQNLNWPSEDVKNTYESAGRFTARNIISTRIQIYCDTAIIVMPRYKSGVPITLGAISLSCKEHNFESEIQPFPNWSIQEEDKCTALQNVVDMMLDKDDILWILDSGIVNTLEQPIRRCTPKIVGIDVKEGKVVKAIDLTPLITSNSHLQYLVADHTNDGQIYLYISDASSRAIIVYDVKTDISFRVILPKFIAKGCKLQDVLYLLLIKNKCGTTFLYFTFLGSRKLYSIDTEFLRKGNIDGYILDVGTKQNNIVLLGTDNGYTIFFRNKGRSDVYMWNTETKFSPENFLLVQKGNECRIPTQVAPGYKSLMWVIESNFHDYVQNTLSCSGASVSLHPLVMSCNS